MKSFRSLLFKSKSKTPDIASLKPFDEIPGPKPLPFIGNIWRYFPIIGQYKLDSLADNAFYNKKRYGNIVREKLTNSLSILHLFEPKHIETLFRKDGKYPYRRSHRALFKYRNNRQDRYNDAGVFPENGPNWYKQRVQFQSKMLSKSYVASNAEKLDKTSLKILDRIDRDLKLQSITTIHNFEHLLNKWSLANSLILFLDLDVNELENAIVEKLIKYLHNSLASTDKTELQTDKWISQPDKCPHYKMLTESEDYLYKFVSDHLCHSNEPMNTSAVSYMNDWIHIDKIDRKDVITFIIDMIMAGMHTTAYTTAFLLYNISENNSIKKSLRDEIETYTSIDSHLDEQQIDKLTLLRCCLKETLRLNPISIGTGRLVSQDDLVIGSYCIPKGTQIITQNQVSSREPSIYEDPNSFKPDRWLKYRKIAKEIRPSPFATLPFGFGSRSCLGQRLAELQIKIFTTRLIQRYDIKFDAKIPIKTTLVHNIDGNIRVNLTKIHSKPSIPIT